MQQENNHSASSEPLAEITLRGILLSIFLTIILAASNTYLALKIGILTSASIPAAILAMSILRFFKGSNILENNLVQTAASAGEAIAGGIVYTIPALIIIHYWTRFDYLHNFAIALIGGVLGVLFSVPLRRVLLKNKALKFPEALAISKVLELGNNKNVHFGYMAGGSLFGAILEFAQTGLQIIANSIQGWFTIGNTLIGFGTGFSATLIGAGYLIGINAGLSLLIGAISSWLILISVLSGVFHVTAITGNATQSAIDLWENHVRYIGIGSMLTAGVWTLLTLTKPIFNGITTSLIALQRNKYMTTIVPRTERDIPMHYVIFGILLCTFATFILLQHLLPISPLGINPHISLFLLISSLLFVLIVGFIFASICGYFSGFVGVTASPGSAIVIGGLLISAFALRAFLKAHQIEFTHEIITDCCAIIIILISIVTGIACITNDNIQDLKVGHLVGSTPWKQQLMLLIGVVVASAVIPLLMQLLFSVYGIGGVFPHSGMDPNKMLSAPVPAVLATITEAVFQRNLPVNMLATGAGITLLFIAINFFLGKKKLSIVGIAMGIYLPLASSTSLFIGSLFSFLIQRSLKKRKSENLSFQYSTILACGLVAGAALMDVLLAIPFAISGNPNILKILPVHGQPIAIILGVLSIIGLGMLFHRLSLKNLF